MYACVAAFIYYFILLLFSLWTSSSNSEMSCTFRADSETRPPPVRVRSVLGTGQLWLWNTSFRPCFILCPLKQNEAEDLNPAAVKWLFSLENGNKTGVIHQPPTESRRGLDCSMALDFHAMWLKWLALSNAFMTEVRKMLRSLWLSLAHFLLLSPSYSQTQSFACWYVGLRFTLPFKILDL